MIINDKNFDLNSERILSWENIYIKDKLRWGTAHSLMAGLTLQKIIKLNKKGLLDLGCGYGRDSYLFSLNKINVFGIDASQTAIGLFPSIKENNGILNLNLVRGDIFDFERFRETYRQAKLFYANYVFHLLSLDELNYFFSELIKNVGTDTHIIFNLISVKDSRFMGEFFSRNADGIEWSFWRESKIKRFLKSIDISIQEIQNYREIEFINNKPDIVDFYFCHCKLK